MYYNVNQKTFRTLSEAIRYRAKNNLIGTISRGPFVNEHTYWVLTYSVD